MSEKYCYSTDGGEYFTGEYDTPQLAAENAFNDNPDQYHVEIGRIVRKTAHDFVDPWEVIQGAQDKASSECGHVSEDWLMFLKSEDRDELKKIIGDWLEKKDPVKFHMVDDIVQTTREEVEAGRFVYDVF